MPALLEDPTSPTIYRTSGQGPYPTPSNPQIPSSIFPKTVTLRDRVTIATLIPFFSPDAVPPRLLAYLSECFNKEIESKIARDHFLVLVVAAGSDGIYHREGCFIVNLNEAAAACQRAEARTILLG